MSLDRRIYRKNSVAARSGRRRSWRSAAGGQRSLQSLWSSSSSTRSERFVDEDWIHSDEPLSSDARTTSDVENRTIDSEITCSSDKTSQASRPDDDARSGEQRLGDDVSALQRPDRHTGLSEEVNNTSVGSISAHVGRLSSTLDFDLNASDVVDGSRVETSSAARSKSYSRPQANPKLKRYVGLSRTEARDRRAVWVSKRLQTSGSTSSQDRDKSLTVNRAASEEDDVHSDSKEHPPAITDIVVNRDDVQQLTRSPSCSENDSSAQANSNRHDEKFDKRLSGGEGTDFISSVELITEMLGLTENMQIAPSELTLSEPDPLSTSTPVAPTRLRSDEVMTTVDNNDDDNVENDGGRIPVHHETSSSSQSPFTSVTEISPLSILSSVYDEAETPAIETTSTISSDSRERTAVSQVAGTSGRRSSLDDVDVQSSVTTGGDMARCSSGSYRTSYGSERDNCKSESSGNVRSLIHLFERATSPSDIQSMSHACTELETVPVFVESANPDADESQRPGDGSLKVGHSTTSGGHNVQTSTSSDQRIDSSSSTSSDIRQHISPVLPPDPVHHHHYHASNSTSPTDNDDKLNADFGLLLDDDSEVGPDVTQLRLSSRLKDDFHRQHRCVFACQVDDRTVVLPRRSLSDPVGSHGSGSHGGFLSDRRNDILAATGTTQLGGVDRAEQGNDLAVCKKNSCDVMCGRQCVRVIAWHRPDHTQRTPLCLPTSGHAPTTDSTDKPAALLNRGMYRQVAGIHAELLTVEIARHKPALNQLQKWSSSHT